MKDYLERNLFASDFAKKVQFRDNYRILFGVTIFIVFPVFVTWRVFVDTSNTFFTWPLFWPSPFSKEQVYNSQLIGTLLYILLLNTVAFGLLLGSILSIFHKIFPLKYVACPNKECDKSILVYTKWTCDHCNNVQTRERYITDKCEHCKRYLETVFCEYCEKEIVL